MDTNGKKILIIDDEPAIANILSLKLNKNGFQVKTAKNGREGLEEMEKDKFDLILLDLVMPEMDGFQVAERLKAKNSKTPVIVISNLGQEEDINRVGMLGVKEYFIKTNTPVSKIVDRIKEILEIK